MLMLMPMPWKTPYNPTAPGIMNLESHPWTMPEVIPWIGLVRCESSVPVLLSACRSTSICCPSSIWQHASMPRTGNATGCRIRAPPSHRGPCLASPPPRLDLYGSNPARLGSASPRRGWGVLLPSPTPSASPKPAWSRLVRSGLLPVCPARIVFEASSQYATH